MKCFLLKKSISLLLAVSFFVPGSSSQTIGTFTSVTPGPQLQTLEIPSTHTFQRIIKSGDALSLGGTLGLDLDFTGYVPTAGSSTNGRLSISSESTPAQVAILEISFSTTNSLWSVSAGGKVLFDPNQIGDVARFCSGTVTPNNTIIVSEENVATGNSNPGVDSYTDRGWLIEIDPVTRTVINQAGGNPVADKLWAVGRETRENAVVSSNNQILYTGTDDPSFGYLYKFVPSTPGVLSSGTLYVLETTAGLGTGTWRAVANTTVADRNGTRALAQAAGGFNFNGIEDVEIGPDGKVYFTAKGLGRIYRFTDNGATVSGLEIFAGNNVAGVTYDVDGAGPLGSESWGIGNDNLAFDGEGNLWVLQDGGRNHIWVIGPTHTQASPQVRLFAKTPVSGEPTGITFTPDYRYMFISFQHPAGGTAQTDAANASVTFNTHTTVVIARKEFLGPLSTLPLSFTSVDAKLSGTGALINWTVANVSNHGYFIVERSVNGVDFEEVHRNNDHINGTSQSFSFTDNNLPVAGIIYYRIKQCDINGQCRYSDIKTVKPNNKNRITQISPQPAKENVNVRFYSSDNGSATVIITDMTGKAILKENHKLVKGLQSITVNTNRLSSGIYLVTFIDQNYERTSRKFMKQ